MKDIAFVVVGVNASFDNGVSLNVAVGDAVESVEADIAKRNARFASLTVSHKLFGSGFSPGAAGTLPAEIQDTKAKKADGTLFQVLVPRGRPVMVRLGRIVVDDWDIANVEER